MTWGALLYKHCFHQGLLVFLFNHNLYCIIWYCIVFLPTLYSVSLVFYYTTCTMIWKTNKLELELELELKCMSDIAPPILRNRFWFNDDVSLRCTRNTNRNLLRPPLCRTQLYQNSFQYIGDVPWNSLSDECRNSNSFSIFKKAVMQEINSLWHNIFLSHEPVKGEASPSIYADWVNGGWF